MNRRRRFLWLLLTLTLIFGAAQAVAGAEPQQQEEFAFLAELATIQAVPGFSPALFRPENEPSRIEIAFFLFRLDQCLAGTAKHQRLGLRDTLFQVWLAANPEADPARAGAWADTAATEYRRLLIEYNREMGALGYRLRPDAYPYWARGNSDVLGN